MQQRQLRLGDILDDYCPRERRVTNHAVVAMVGADVKQTRCTTCDTEHEYKHAKVPRQRRKTETPAALYAQVLSNGPKRVAHEHDPAASDQQAAPPASAEPEDGHVEGSHVDEPHDAAEAPQEIAAAAPQDDAQDGQAAEPLEGEGEDDADRERDDEEGPIHRRLIRASLPRPEGQPPPVRPIPEFTIRQPGGRQNRFRPRHQRGGGGGQQFGGGGNRSNGNVHGGPPRGNMRGPGGGRPPHGGGPMPQRMSGRRRGPDGRKRSK
jgi:hypothetical protein